MKRGFLSIFILFLMSSLTFSAVAAGEKANIQPITAILEKANNQPIELIQPTESPVIGTAVGNKLPSINFTSINGEKLSVESLQGKKVLINFTATWCKFCNAEKLIFQEEYKKLAEANNLEVIVVFGDFGAGEQQDSIPKVKEYLAANKYTFPTYFDRNRYLIDLFTVKSLPSSILVDENGIVIERAKEFHKLKMLKR